MTSDAVPCPVPAPPPEDPPDADRPSVVVARTGGGWRVLAPGCAQHVGDLLEGMSLADLVAEELGSSTAPDRTARRAARGGADAGPAEDPRDSRIAALERTVAQLEHALAARVATERAIGVLAERHATAPRTAFEVLRAQARSLGRPVHELAREVMATLDRLAGPTPPVLPAAAPPPPVTPPPAAAPPAAAPPAAEVTALAPVPRRPSGRRVERGAHRPGPAVPADGRP